MITSSFANPSQVRDAHVEVGIAAGDAGRGRMRHRRGAAGADHAPLGAGQLREPLADRLHHFIEVRVLLVGRALRRPHLRQLDRSADDRQRAAAVDQRPDADRLVDVRLDRRPGRGGARAPAPTTRRLPGRPSRRRTVPRGGAGDDGRNDDSSKFTPNRHTDSATRTGNRPEPAALTSPGTTCLATTSIGSPTDSLEVGSRGATPPLAVDARGELWRGLASALCSRAKAGIGITILRTETSLPAAPAASRRPS